MTVSLLKKLLHGDLTRISEFFSKGVNENQDFIWSLFDTDKTFKKSFPVSRFRHQADRCNYELIFIRNARKFFFEKNKNELHPDKTRKSKKR